MVKAVVCPHRIESGNSEKKWEHLPPLRARPNYRFVCRHIIDWLVRKPGAFASYRYREHLFPSSRFRMAYDLLQVVMPGRCDRRYLQILEVAAKEGEALVEDALRLLLASERGKQTIAGQEGVEPFLKRCEQS